MSIPPQLHEPSHGTASPYCDFFEQKLQLSWLSLPADETNYCKTTWRMHSHLSPLIRMLPRTSYTRNFRTLNRWAQHTLFPSYINSLDCRIYTLQSKFSSPHSEKQTLFSKTLLEVKKFQEPSLQSLVKMAEIKSFFFFNGVLRYRNLFLFQCFSRVGPLPHKKRVSLL